MKQLLFVILIIDLLLLPGLVLAGQPTDTTYQPLPFAQDWTNTDLITTSDDWMGVSGIVGYRGDGLTTTTGTDPQTILADGTSTPVDVNANQTNPDTYTAGRVTEFEIANPVIALNGSGTADAPFIVLHLDTTSFSNIQVAYNLRDLDGSVDHAVQQVALHYRVGSTGDFVNLPAGYVADATTGPSLATLVTPVAVTLPAAADNQPAVQVRIMTTNAVGNDEWVGVDDLMVTGAPILADPVINEFSASTTGTDVEYVELLGAANTDYSVHTILEIEGDSESNEGTVDEVIAAGTADAAGFWLANLAANTLENGTVTLLLVKGFSGAFGADLDTNDDGVLDSNPWEALFDAVAVNDGGVGDLTYGTPVLGPNYDGIDSFAPGGASRIPDGTDTDAAADWVRNDFDLAGIPGFTGTSIPGEALNTPGAANQTVPTADVPPTVTGTTPANGATTVPVADNIRINFSEVVDVSTDGISVECPAGAAVAFAGLPANDVASVTLNPTADLPYDTTCVVTVHAADVTESNVLVFSGNWYGTGSISGSGAAEALCLDLGEYMVSEVVETGTQFISLTQNAYNEAGDDVTLQYRHGATVGDCTSAAWNNYTAAFDSLGYVQIRLTPPVVLNAASDQADNLAAWWPTVNYAPGVNLKEMIAGNDGILNGSIGTVNDATIRTMLRFVGTAGASFSVASATAINITGTMSVSFWMTPRWPVLAQYYGILGKGAEWPRDESQFMFYHVDGGEGGIIDWQIGIGTDAFIVAEASPLSVGTLYHVVGVHDGTNMKTYLNVTDVETWDGTASNIAISTEPLTIGYTDVNGGVYAYCDMADIRIYDKVLSAAEVAALYAVETRWELYDATQVCVQDVELNLLGTSSPSASPSASVSRSASESASPSASVSTSPSLGPSGCVCWGHSTGVTDNDGTPDPLAADYVISFTTAAQGLTCAAADTPIGLIQGTGAAFDPAHGGTQTVQGVVVGDYEGPSPALRGFYVQNLPAEDDDNPATSDAVFIFEGDSADRVSVGQVVQVTGSVSDYQDQTQIASTTVEVCPADVPPALPVTHVTLPFASADYLERYEGMLVTLPQTLYVTEHFQLGRFNQVVLSSGARLRQPTAVTDPGASALALQAANDLNRIIVDDAFNSQNSDPIAFGRNGSPLSASNTLRGGDTVTDLQGVLTYTWSGNSASGNAYRVRPPNAEVGKSPNFMPANARPVAASDPGGTLKVAGMNLLNFFNTFDGLPDTVDNCANGVGGAATDCRGADTQAEFDRQWAKTIAAIVKTEADVIAIGEIENDGYGADSAIQFLVTQLNAATAAGTYAFIDADVGAGQINALGTDAIKVGLLYKPTRVMLVGTTAALNSVAFVNGGDAAARNRPALAQAFQQADGERFIVVANHLKSKGSACDTPDAGDGQGNCNVVRTNAAAALLAWLATDPTGTGETDVLLMGDLNSYAREDPITALEAGGYTNLIQKYGGQSAYGYVFDGQWGYLDHALVSASLVSQVRGAGDYHINADEPSVLDYNLDFKSIGQQASLYAADEFRMSDHDPVVVGLALGPQRIYLPLISKVIPSPDCRIAPRLISPPDGSNPATAHAVFQWNNGDNPRARIGRYEFALTPTFQPMIYWGQREYPGGTAAGSVYSQPTTTFQWGTTY